MTPFRLEASKITEFIKFDTGNRDASLGRIGVITKRDRHPGSFDAVHVAVPMATDLPSDSPTFLLLAKATNHGFPFTVERVLGQTEQWVK